MTNVTNTPGPWPTGTVAIRAPKGHVIHAFSVNARNGRTWCAKRIEASWVLASAETSLRACVHCQEGLDALAAFRPAPAAASTLPGAMSHLLGELRGIRIDLEEMVGAARDLVALRAAQSAAHSQSHSPCRRRGAE